jgi:hypothetical protein
MRKIIGGITVLRAVIFLFHGIPKQISFRIKYLFFCNRADICTTHSQYIQPKS